MSPMRWVGSANAFFTWDWGCLSIPYPLTVWFVLGRVRRVVAARWLRATPRVSSGSTRALPKERRNVARVPPGYSCPGLRMRLLLWGEGNGGPRAEGPRAEGKRAVWSDHTLGTRVC